MWTRTTTVAVFAALTALSNCASAHDTAVSTESDELHHAPIDHLEYEIDADTLNLDVRINDRVGGIFTLTRITDLYEGPAKATNAFRLSNASCHVVATETSPGKLHGVWHNLRSGTTIQFDHVDRIGEDMGARGRALRAESPSRYLLTSASKSFDCMAVTPERSPAEQAAIARKRAAFSPKMTVMSDPLDTTAALQTADVYYGDDLCFPGDSERHSMVIGFVMDKSFEDRFGGDTAAMMGKLEEAMVDVNAVYERQFNVMFKIGPVHRYSEMPNALSEFDHCGAEDKENVIQRLLDDIKTYSASLREADRRGHWHLLTDCLAGPGTKGWAFVGTAGCHRLDSGYNTALTSYTSWDFWRILAHEIGHGMSMGHSTENGDLYNTAGIMGYGDSNINGEPAFRPERAAESCAHWERLVNDACPYFVEDSVNKEEPAPPVERVEPSDQCLKLRYNQAVKHCESLGFSLCTREALQASPDTVCGFDDGWVWVQANPCAEDNKERAFKRSAGRQKCKRKRSDKIGVRCCSST